MKTNQMLKGLIVAAFMAQAVVAQEPGKKQDETPQEVSQEFQVDKNAAISESVDIDKMIGDFLAKQGWGEGQNINKDGSTFFVAIGKGVIQSGRSEKSYINSRINAFEKALLNSKAQMIEFLSTQISKDASLMYEQGNFPPTLDSKEEKSEIIKKIKMLIHAELDKRLKDRGVDPKSKEGKAELEKQISSESFKSMTRTLSQSRILGLQAYKTFEASPDNKKGQVAVLCIYSDKLRELAEAMIVGGSVPAGAPKRPIAEQIPNDPLVLLSTYGVQIKLDENGQPVLLAFAHDQPLTESVMSENAASEKAKALCFGLIRQFAGESSMVSRDLLNAETTKEYADATDLYKNESAYRQQIESTAKAINISGISKIKSWNTTHPLTGKKVFGVVCAWSPSSAVAAKLMKSKLGSAASSDSSNGSAALLESGRKKINEDQKGTFKNEGTEADKDAF